MELDLVKLIADLGTGALFSVAVLLMLRDERKSREAAREADRAVLAAMSEALARIDDRTAALLGEMTPVERPPPPRRTPPTGVSTEYAVHRRRDR